MPDGERDQHRDEVRSRLEMLDALLLAIERRTEVLDVIASSESATAARDRLAEMLGVSEVGVMAILDLQLRRFAELEFARIRHERDELRSGAV